MTFGSITRNEFNIKFNSINSTRDTDNIVNSEDKFSNKHNLTKRIELERNLLHFQ